MKDRLNKTFFTYRWEHTFSPAEVKQITKVSIKFEMTAPKGMMPSGPLTLNALRATSYLLIASTLVTHSERTKVVLNECRLTRK